MCKSDSESEYEEVSCEALNLVQERAVEGEFYNVFSSMPYAIVLYQSNSDNHLVIQDFNIQAASILHITANVRGKTAIEAFPDLNPLILDAMKKALYDGDVWINEAHLFLSKNNKNFYDIRVFQCSSGVIAVMFQDITERIQHTEEIKRINATLEERVEERTLALKSVQEELLEQAHYAGMAQIATNVLHNVGNLLNSVGFTIYGLQEMARKPVKNKLSLANQLLETSLESLDGFIEKNPKGAKLLQYFLALQPEFEKENKKLKNYIGQLMDSMNAINDIIITQMHVASGPALSEQFNLKNIVLDVLVAEAPSLQKSGIELETYFADTVDIIGLRSKLIHVLTNLIKNAKESILEKDREIKKIIIELKQINGDVQLKITDSGSGVKAENLTRIFNHGFTTKESGFGFGLHSCANYVKEMNGSIEVSSDGEDKGATFRLLFSSANFKGDNQS